MQYYEKHAMFTAAFGNADNAKLQAAVEAGIGEAFGQYGVQRSAWSSQTQFNITRSGVTVFNMYINIDNEGNHTFHFYSLGEGRQANWEVDKFNDIGDLFAGMTQANAEKKVLEAIETFARMVATKYRQPLVGGTIAAYFSEDDLFYLRKKPTSENVAQIGGRYYFSKENPRLCRVYRSANEFEYILRRQITGNTVTLVGDEYWFNDSLTPIYSTAIPFDQIITRVTRHQAERGFETVNVDGEIRFINQAKPANVYFAQPINEYNQRIEQFVTREQLFRMGQTDLYQRRDQGEVPFLGWELEAITAESRIPQSSLATIFKEQMPYWLFCKRDGSITPAGFEVVSVPATLDAWKESDLRDALDVMRADPHKMRSHNYPSCGFHVHVSRSALSVLDLQKIERFMHNPENRTFLTAIAGRSPNNYQSFIDDMFKDRKKLAERRTTRAGTRSVFEAEDVNWFGGNGVAYAIEQLNNRSYTLGYWYENLYQWASNHIQFSSINGNMMLRNPELFARMRLFSHDVMVCIEEYAGGGYDGSRENQNYSQVCEELIRELASWGPTLNQAVRHFAPQLNIPELVVEPVNTTPVSPALLQFKKSEAPVGRKNSYKAAQTIKGIVGKDGNRYSVLNTNNPATVEFRLFKGTMNPDSVFRYLEFVDALVRFVPHTSAQDAGLHYTVFLEWLISDSFNVQRYEHLVGFCLQKDYIERTKIRRKDVKTEENGDGTPPLQVVRKEFKDETTAKPPLYTITTTGTADPAPDIQNADQVAAQYDPESEYPDDYDYFDPSDLEI